jgi:hypothetical protein
MVVGWARGGYEAVAARHAAAGKRPCSTAAAVSEWHGGASREDAAAA